MAAINNRPAVLFSATGIRETVVLDARVVAHVCGYRQLSSSSFEAGGQLFGLVADGRVTASIATGPYCRDERARYHYRSHPASAQRAIRRQAKRGFIYLGEWHTHDENVPRPSGSDENALRTLRLQSDIRVNSLLLLIVGRAAPPDNLCLCSTDGGPLQDWTVGEINRVSDASRGRGARDRKSAIRKYAP